MVNKINLWVYNDLFTNREMRKMCKSGANMSSKKGIDDFEKIDIVVIQKLKGQDELREKIEALGKPVIELQGFDSEVIRKLPEDIIELTKGKRNSKVAYFALYDGEGDKEIKETTKYILTLLVFSFQNQIKIPAKLHFNQEMFRKTQHSITSTILSIFVVIMMFFRYDSWWQYMGMIACTASLFTSTECLYIANQAKTYGIDKKKRAIVLVLFSFITVAAFAVSVYINVKK